MYPTFSPISAALVRRGMVLLRVVDKLRKRGGASIKGINISPENRQSLEKIVKNGMRDVIKKQIKQLTEGSPCCVCYGIPDYEIIYNVGDELQNATRVQGFCNACFKKVYEWYYNENDY